jgi:hypothetical protein
MVAVGTVASDVGRAGGGGRGGRARRCVCVCMFGLAGACCVDEAPY